MNGGRRVVIAGGGVAALEAMLTLHELAGDRVAVELLAPQPRFWYRPLAVAEPFGLGSVTSFELTELTGAAGAGFQPGSLAAVDARAHEARTSDDKTIEYDSLLVACGAEARPTVAGAPTFRGPADMPLLRDLLTDLRAGRARTVVVTVPIGAHWSLPAYELALLLARHADAENLRGVDVVLVTPEDDPLFLFGAAARDEVLRLLDEVAVDLRTGVHATHLRDGVLHLFPQGAIPADRVVALPQLQGPRIDGLPQTRSGFVPVDRFGRVDGLEDVYAAGDVTTFPIKQGGIAAQQADAAAESIAADAGADVRPEPFRPVLRGLLLTGRDPRFLRRDVSEGVPGAVSTEPLWWPPTKIVGRRLAPFLASRTAAGDGDALVPAGTPVERELRADELARLAPPLFRARELSPGEPVVGDVMTADPLAVAPEDSLGEIAERMRDRDVASALVVDYGRLIGILTARDLLRAFAGRIHSSEARAREWMTAEPIVVQAQTPVAEALRLMNAHAIHHLPVVEGGRAVGTVGLRALARTVEESAGDLRVGLGF